MNRQQIVVNTIAFVEQVSQGEQQLTFFAQLAALGIQYVEVRQEYFSGRDELADTARVAEQYGLKLLYSVPKPLFQNGRLDTDMIEETLREASQLAVIAIKWTRGNFVGWQPQDLEWMLNKAKSFSGLLTVENDQTEQDGTLRDYLAFLKQCSEVGVPLRSTFDVGNWAWVGEEARFNAQQLHSFVAFIHLKDVRINSADYPTGPEAVPLGEGELPLKEVLAALPHPLLVALEYPCGSRPLDLLETGIRWLENVGS